MELEKLPTIVTHTFAYDGGRLVSVSVPSAPAEAIVFAGDGQLIAPWGSLLASTDAPPTMVVGVHRTPDANEMVRIREYSPDFDEGRFNAHEAFFVEQVAAWVRTHFDVDFPPERTAVCGVSAGGELSLSLGIRHPETYGFVFSLSPGGGYRPPADLPPHLPKVYLTAGTQEPFFLENATRWAKALETAGTEVVLTERHGDHGDPFWADEFPKMIAWAFNR